MVRGHVLQRFVSSSPRASFPFQSPPGQMAAFVSLLEAKAKDAGTAKNDHKQVETRSHSMIRRHPAQHCSLRGIEPATYGYKTIALTAELSKGTLHAGQS